MLFKKIMPFIVIIVLCFILCACGNASKEVAATPSPSPAATPAPTPEPTPEPKVIIMDKDVLLSDVEKGYTFELFGQTVNTKDTTELHYSEVDIGDDGLRYFRQVLPYMYGLKYLTFDRCNTTDEAVATLREDFPDANIAWRIFFKPFSCMTDTETIWASCDLRDNYTEPLKYCNKLKNLDIGHNAIHSLWFLEYMPELEVLIISCSDIEDLSDLKYCKNLKFLEVAETRVKDISPVALCENLEYLNIGGNGSMRPENIEKLYSLKHLKRFFIANYFCYAIDLGAEEKKVKELMPDCEVNFHDCYDCGALNGLWRYRTGGMTGGYNAMYIWIRETFGYDSPTGQSRLYDKNGMQIYYTPPESKKS